MKPQPWYITPKISYKNKTALIIGGGLAGTCATYSLARRGWNITLIERGEKLANAASGNPVGIVAPMIAQKTDPVANFYMKGFEYSLNHIKKIEQLTTQKLFTQCSVINLGKADSDLSFNVVPGDDIRKINASEASELSGVKIKQNGLYLSKAGIINPAYLCAANIISCGSQVKIIYSQEILSLVQNESGWEAINNAGRKVANAEVCIIANAVDANNFTQTSWINLQAVRGQLTYLKSGLNLKTVLSYDGGYISPAIGGINYVGATYSRSNLSLKPNVEDHGENINNLKKIIDIPDMDLNELEGRASLRAMVADRRPIIGMVPDVAAFAQDYAGLKHGRIANYPNGKYLRGLYVSTGHGSRGLTSAPIGGEIIAGMIEGEAGFDDDILNLVSPTRVVINNIKRNGS